LDENESVPNPSDICYQMFLITIFNLRTSASKAPLSQLASASSFFREESIIRAKGVELHPQAFRSGERRVAKRLLYGEGWVQAILTAKWQSSRTKHVSRTDISI